MHLRRRHWYFVVLLYNSYFIKCAVAIGKPVQNKSSEITVQNISNCRPMEWQFCTRYGSVIAVFCAKYRNDWTPQNSKEHTRFLEIWIRHGFQKHFLLCNISSCQSTRQQKVLTEAVTDPTIVNMTHRNKLKWNVHRNSYIFIQENAFGNVVCEMSVIISRLHCVKPQ